MLLPTPSHCALPKASHYCMYHLIHVLYCKHGCLYRAQRSTRCINTCHTLSSAQGTYYKTSVPQNSRKPPCLLLNRFTRLDRYEHKSPVMFQAPSTNCFNESHSIESSSQTLLQKLPEPSVILHIHMELFTSSWSGLLTLLPPALFQN